MRATTMTILVLATVGLGGCPKPEVISSPFVDDFQRVELGNQYHNTGAPYEIVDGKLTIKGAYNRPLWLRKRLPRDATIELDVTSNSAAGDIKVEAWGDGRSHATHKGAYMATSYVFIFGGWGNRVSALVRMDEHAPDRVQRSDARVEPGKPYQFKISRRGKRVEWHVDGKPFLALDDPQPLEGPGHDSFGFNNWESEVVFDNLKIAPLR